MNSSMIRWAIFRSAAMISSTIPSSSSTISGSLRSKSIDPRRCRRRLRIVEQLPHPLEHRHERAVARRDVRIVIGEDRVDVGVGHARVAVDDAVMQLVANDRAPCGRFPSGRTGPADRRADSGCTARWPAPTGTCALRGRGSTPRSALVGFLVERAVFRHVVRDVGDVHAEPVMAVGELLEGDRIVEVARVLAVDGDRSCGRKSVRPARSRSRTSRPSRRASSTASGLCASGMPYLRMMISVSTPGASMSPSTSMTRPSGPARGCRPPGDLDRHHVAGLRRLSAHRPECGRP